VKIMATNDLNERKISALLAAGAPIDAFGVGTELATSADAPSLSAVYKLVELRSGNAHTYTAKYSEDKSTLPGAKQIYRCADHDLMTLYTDCEPESKGEPLLQPILVAGVLVEPYPALENLRAYASSAVAKLPPSLLSLEAAPEYPVKIGGPLLKLGEDVRNSRQMVAS
jgi:nicotinate phosphoribosyltransferase